MLIPGDDGAFVRGAEWARDSDHPQVGVNLGRIEFLAEGEGEAIDKVVEHVVARDYRVENRMTLGVGVRDHGTVSD
uniref:NAD(+)/NADH kinase n=1 Tax=Mycobacterium avium TaxID=1764 RepID=UPI000A5639B7